MTSKTKVKLKPGDTIGILGGGQLGRMLALAAARLGLRCNVYSPDPDSPAFDVVQHATCAEYADVAALELFAPKWTSSPMNSRTSPRPPRMILAARRPVLPDPSVLEITQDRLARRISCDSSASPLPIMRTCRRSRRCERRSKHSACPQC